MESFLKTHAKVTQKCLHEIRQKGSNLIREVSSWCSPNSKRNSSYVFNKEKFFVHILLKHTLSSLTNHIYNFTWFPYNLCYAHGPDYVVSSTFFRNQGDRSATEVFWLVHTRPILRALILKGEKNSITEKTWYLTHARTEKNFKLICHLVHF